MCNTHIDLPEKSLFSMTEKLKFGFWGQWQTCLILFSGTYTNSPRPETQVRSQQGILSGSGWILSLPDCRELLICPPDGENRRCKDSCEARLCDKIFFFSNLPSFSIYSGNKFFVTFKRGDGFGQKFHSTFSVAEIANFHR